MPTLYDRRVLNDPEVRLSYGDPLIPIMQPDQVELHLSNDDGYFDALDLIGERITYSRFDGLSNETWAELTGKVSAQELLHDRIILRCVTYDLDDFQTLLPKEVVTATTFPLAHPQQGLGKPIPIIFGNAASTNKVSDAWEMAYVGENVGSNQYDYLVGRGTFANPTVYRDTVGDALFIVPPAEYAVNTAAYPGFTIIRFALRQANFGGGLHRLYIAADGLATERNFARAIQSLLSNATWGLGLSVHTASFDTAAAALATIGGLYCDGVMDTQQTAYDWLSQLVNVRGIRVEPNTSGEYVVTVDTQAQAIKGKFGHGVGQPWNGVVAGGFRGLSTTPVNEAIKSLVLEYRKDRRDGHYVLATSSRSVLAVGTDERVQHDFIRDRTTADKTACYWANRYVYEKDRLAFTGDQMARKLRPGELLQYESMRPSFNKTFRVFDVGRQLTTSDIQARGWSAAIYTYTAGTLPAEPSAITETDFTRQTPTAVSGLGIVSAGVETDGQNAFMAKVTLQYTVPAETWAQTIVRYRRNGTTNWQTAAVNQATGSSLQTQITGLITGASYDYQVSRINVMAPSLSADAALTAQVASADTTAPGAPTGLTLVDKHLKNAAVSLTPPADKDIAEWHWEIRTAASGGGSLVVEGDSEGRGSKIQLPPLDQIAYGTTRHLRVRGHDFSGNVGAYSSSLSFSFVQAETIDLEADSVTTNSFYSADGTTLVGATEKEVGTITVTTDGTGRVELQAKFNAEDILPTHNVTLRIRETSISGAILDQTNGTINLNASNMVDHLVGLGVDTSPGTSQVYKLTAQYSHLTAEATILWRRLKGTYFKR